MDEGEVLLKAGDVLIQRGTNHAWSNRTDAPCYVAFVLIDAEPVYAVFRLIVAKSGKCHGSERKFRRVVTTVDANGKAVVLFDGDNPHKVVRPNRSVTSRLVWVTDQTPADMSGTADRARGRDRHRAARRRLGLPHHRHPADPARDREARQGLPAQADRRPRARRRACRRAIR